MAIIADHHPLCFAFGLMGNILSFMVYLAPLPTFYRVYQKKSTEGFQSIPYVVALFSAMLWLYYGLLKADGSMLITINTIGCTIETIYIIMYLIYAPKGAKIFTVKLLLLLNVGAFGLILIFTLQFAEGLKRVTILGWVNSVLAVSVFAAPLSIMRLVIRTKSVEFMPLSLSFFLTLCAVMWFFYGLLMKDYFIALPNILGFLFGIVQMVLYIIYKGAKDAKTNVVPKLQLPELVLDVDLKTIDDPKVQPSENQPIETVTNQSNEPVEPSECNV